MRLLLAITLVFSTTGVAMNRPLSVGANFLWHRNESNRMEGTALKEMKPFEWADVRAGARLGLNVDELKTFEWSAETAIPIYDALVPALRLSNVSHLAHATHHAALLLRLGTRTPELWSTRLFFELGWFFRFVSLSTSVPVPFWGGTSFSEQDVAVALGLRGDVGSGWSWEARASTYDDFDAHNFNQPLLLLQVSNARADLSQWTLFFRNDFLLGFGRSHSWRLGLNYRFAFDRN